MARSCELMPGLRRTYDEPLPDEVTIHRAVRKLWVRPDGTLKIAAFVLRGETETRPAETGLSASEIQQNALNSLTNMPGTCRLIVLDVRSAPGFNFDILHKHDEQDPGYCHITGVPLATAPEEDTTDAARALLKCADYEPK